MENADRQTPAANEWHKYQRNLSECVGVVVPIGGFTCSSRRLDVAPGNGTCELEFDQQAVPNVTTDEDPSRSEMNL